MKNKYGFTLVEILVSLAIMAVAITGTLRIMNYVLQINETNEVQIPGMNAVEGMMDEIRNVPFDDISAKYDNTQFTLNILTNRGIPHVGTVDIQTIVPNYLLRVKIVLCWQQKTRVIGEDTNLNGFLDGGEDTDGNGELDSPCFVEAMIRYET